MLKHEVFLELDAISRPSPGLQWADKEKSKKETKLCWIFAHRFFPKHKRLSLTTMKVVANNSIIFFPLLWFDTYIENNTLLIDKSKPNQINSDSIPDLATFHNISLCVNHASKYMLQAGIHSQCHLYK